MHEKMRRVRCELTAIFKGRFERALMNAEPIRPNGRKNLLACDPHYRPSNKSGNNAQNDSYHRFPPPHQPWGGCHSSTLFPSGSMTQANFPYSESSIFSSTLQPSSFKTLTKAWRSSTR